MFSTDGKDDELKVRLVTQEAVGRAAATTLTWTVSTIPLMIGAIEICNILQWRLFSKRGDVESVTWIR